MTTQRHDSAVLFRIVCTTLLIATLVLLMASGHTAIRPIIG